MSDLKLFMLLTFIGVPALFASAVLFSVVACAASATCSF